MTDVLEKWEYFSSPVYSIMKPEFLEPVSMVTSSLLTTARQNNKMNEIYPIVQTEVQYVDETQELLDYVLNTAWNLLSGQGYLMNGLSTYFTECWVQEHHKYSSMEYHTHNNCHLSAFYFLECPKDPPKMVIHDPRVMKSMVSLYEEDTSKITDATPMINFTPEPGQLIFTNSWLPHSFTRNQADTPFTIIHMNISTRVYNEPIVHPATAEII